MIKRHLTKIIFLFTVGILFPICNFVLGQTPEIIEKIEPATAKAGTNNLDISITLLDLGTPPIPPSEVIPSSITFGNIEANSISRDELIISAKISIPEDETNGLKDVSISFPGPNSQTITFTKTVAFEITGGKDDEAPNLTGGEGGETLFTPLGSKNTYLINQEGKTIHTWTSDYRPALSCYLLNDKSLLRTANGNNPNFPNAAGTCGKIERFDWNGNLIWEFELEDEKMMIHHDIEYLPNGNILAIAFQYKSDDEAIAAGRKTNLLSNEGLWQDVIIEIEPTFPSGGDIIWKWETWDHLVQDVDTSKPNYGDVSENFGKIDINYALMPKGGDWTHFNGIDYNEELDQILITSRNFSEVWIIDHNTSTEEAAGKKGDLLYRWGNPAAYGRGTEADQMLYVPHNAEWIMSGYPGEGDILIFNNGQNRSDGNYSTIDQFTPPIVNGKYEISNNEAFAPSNLSWTYKAATPTEFFSTNISGAQRLKGGNTLICEGTTGRMFEVEEDGTIVWQYINPYYNVQQADTNRQVFRATRYDVKTMGSGTPNLTIPYPIVDTGQDLCYNSKGAEIESPSESDDFYGQDAQFNGNLPNYTDNGDGTITDNVTGLMWSKSSDLNGDGTINVADKLTQAQAEAGAEEFTLGGYDDWRLPTIKELYSLIMFSGKDVSGYSGTDTENLTPFIDSDYFEIGYGDMDAGERIIDAQFATTTIYVSTTMNGARTMFGVNLADGRIKGYPTDAMQGGEGKLFYVHYVRGNAEYGINDFVDNEDGTITDKATGLMWSQDDSKTGLNWQEALAWVKQKNSENFLGHNDWSLPNVKELQSIVDYTRSPATSGTAAIDPLFTCTEITDEGGEPNFPFYWSATTHANMQNGSSAAYVAFGEGLGFMTNQQGNNPTLMDVHGAGCQRSDPKEGNPEEYPTGHGPQGDVIRIYNYVRLVRAAEPDVSINENRNLYHEMELYQNTPNPVQNSTDISFTISNSQDITLAVYDELGQKVAEILNSHLEAGEHSYNFDAKNLNSGVYYYILNAGDKLLTKMMTVVK